MATHSSILAWRMNPRDRGAWWAAFYGVTQSQIRTTEATNSSSLHPYMPFTKHCLIMARIQLNGPALLVSFGF